MIKLMLILYVLLKFKYNEAQDKNDFCEPINNICKLEERLEETNTGLFKIYLFIFISV